ncbi:glycoside hydrolase 5 family protein [Rufibacter tibetensis]|uniref:mannan endo-1,4-beta-mannosidase n=1 Tax=Rufibacter tibetensis TaxID=512763 RepID=A0A0N7HW79_9BACT|nr:cellulase family glycosylhydrolase [Rufibacter tibetensis]ALI98496.1 beta-mannosidase [Rufibacter tibetensis]
MKNIYFLLALLCSTLTQLYAQKTADFVKTDGHMFTLGGRPYYYIGTNYWYGGLLASTGQGGDRTRLTKELDLLKKVGVTNLRVLAGAEGPNNQPYRVSLGLQMSPGVYNDTLLAGLDFLLAEMAKRDMKAVLYLNNAWEWSGGFSQYVNWNTNVPIPYALANNNDWASFMKYSGQFLQCDPCKQQFADHIRYMLSRTNQYTNKKYTEDPTIMSWQIANEPRAFSMANVPAYDQWIKSTAALFKSLDKNHLVSTGSEGSHGSEGSMEVFKQVHTDPNIDYFTMHIWPRNWGWLDSKNIAGTLDSAIVKTNQYMERHIAFAREQKKPIVLEEFGLQRDNNEFSPSAKTTFRDWYYQNAFERVLISAKEKDALAGANFWAFNGTARPHPTRHFWKPGDALMGDPPQEEQGLYGVYDTDSTMPLIAKYTKAVKKAGKKKKK